MIQRIPPQDGQESVWDYPRPPRVEPTPKRIRVIFNGVTLVDTTRAYRVLETSHPPVYYVPPADTLMSALIPIPRTTYCEFKGAASYMRVSVGDKSADGACWYYPTPAAGFEAIAGYFAFYPHLMDACYVDDEQVQAQAGGFYGGWITRDIVGPFKGAKGTWGW
jgi:uncharacterized protein (DUF427 family)